MAKDKMAGAVVPGVPGLPANTGGMRKQVTPGATSKKSHPITDKVKPHINSKAPNDKGTVRFGNADNKKGNRPYA